MKYSLTWSNIFIANILRIGIGFILFHISVLGIVILGAIVSGDIFENGFSLYVVSFWESLFLISLVFFGLVFGMILVSIPYWKKNIVGEHSLKIEDGYFIWEGKNQEVRTSLTRLKKLKIHQKYFYIKFDGIRSAKIYRKWAVSGYDSFVEQLENEYKKIIAGKTQ